jgi:hypothetical protein
MISAFQGAKITGMSHWCPTPKSQPIKRCLSGCSVASDVEGHPDQKRALDRGELRKEDG